MMFSAHFPSTMAGRRGTIIELSILTPAALTVALLSSSFAALTWLYCHYYRQLNSCRQQCRELNVLNRELKDLLQSSKEEMKSWQAHHAELQAAARSTTKTIYSQGDSELCDTLIRSVRGRGRQHEWIGKLLIEEIRAANVPQPPKKEAEKSKRYWDRQRLKELDPTH